MWSVSAGVSEFRSGHRNPVYPYVVLQSWHRTAQRTLATPTNRHADLIDPWLIPKTVWRSVFNNPRMFVHFQFRIFKLTERCFRRVRGRIYYVPFLASVGSNPQIHVRSANMYARNVDM